MKINSGCIQLVPTECAFNEGICSCRNPINSKIDGNMLCDIHKNEIPVRNTTQCVCCNTRTEIELYPLCSDHFKKLLYLKIHVSSIHIEETCINV